MNEKKIPKLMKAREYAKHVQTDVRTVRRWMRKGLLKFIPPPKEHPHYARLIDSSQPRPKKKKRAKSTNTAKPKVKSTANIPRPVDKQPANIPRQVDKRTANVPRPVDKQPANIPRQVDKRLPNVAGQPNEKMADQDNEQSAIILLAVVALAQPAFDLFNWLYKKMQQRSSLPTQTIGQNTQRNISYIPPDELSF